MLARIAENMFWMARYLERAEDLARLINVNTHLVLDLPRGLAPSWDALITIVGADAAFAEKFGSEQTEARVLRWLITDRDNGQSIASSLAFARENARTFRDGLPREVWEEINGLHIFARENEKSGLTKRGRFGYLKEIIRRCQTTHGVLAGSMSRDQAYRFMRMGRYLERADMTTRIIDVRSANLLDEEVADLRPFEMIQWISVLKSLTGYQMYRQEMQVRVRRADVLRFLFQSDTFPRSVAFSLGEVLKDMEGQGDSEAPARVIQRVLRGVNGVEVQELAQASLHDFIDQVQEGVIDTAEAIITAYFRATPAEQGQLQAQG